MLNLFEGTIQYYRIKWIDMITSSFTRSTLYRDRYIFVFFNLSCESSSTDQFNEKIDRKIITITNDQIISINKTIDKRPIV